MNDKFSIVAWHKNDLAQVIKLTVNPMIYQTWSICETNNCLLMMSLPIGYMEPPRYIQPSALAEILRDSSTTSKRPVIIDVRDTDYAGGHIRSAVNIPEDNFMDDDDVDALVEKYKDEDAIVFHCMMSQVRGPSCAKRFKSRMEVVLEGAKHKPRVLILHGGFERFGRIYKDEADLIEVDD